MSRSKWKGPYINYIEEKNEFNFSETKNNYIKVSRNMTVAPEFVERTLKIHNGKAWVDVNVTEKMVGYKFGEFSPTRKRFFFKKTKK